MSVRPEGVAGRSTCRTLVITCLDFRIQTAVRDYLVATGREGDFDLVVVAGGVKGLAEDAPEAQAFLLEQVALATRLHRPEEVLFIPHEDCLAYGGSGAFASQGEEWARHREAVGKAQSRIRERFPAYRFAVAFAVKAGEGYRVVDDLEG